MKIIEIDIHNICDLEPVVYFIKDNHGLVKIGKTKSLKKRIKNIQKTSGKEFEEVFAVKGYTNTEKFFHKLYKNKRTIGEWFDIDFNELKEVVLLQKEFKEEKEKSIDIEKFVDFLCRSSCLIENKEFSFFEKFGSVWQINESDENIFKHNKKDLLKCFEEGSEEYNETLKDMEGFSTYIDYQVWWIFEIFRDYFDCDFDDMADNKKQVIIDYLYKRITLDELYKRSFA